MQFAAVLFATAASAASFPRAAAPLAGRSATTVSVAGDAAALLGTLARPAAAACGGGPVALSDACHATYQCSEAAAADAAVFDAAQARLAAAIGPVTQGCVCTCGTYCCPLCTNSVPESVQVENLGVTITCT